MKLIDLINTFKDVDIIVYQRKSNKWYTVDSETVENEDVFMACVIDIHEIVAYIGVEDNNDNNGFI